MATKRWAVRGRFAYNYILLVGDKPRKPRGGWDGLRRKRWFMSTASYEGFFDKKYHLPPDGGPVLIEFTDEA